MAHAAFYPIPFFSSGSGEISDLLNKATLRAVSNEECTESFGGERIVGSIICARNDGEDGAGTCQVNYCSVLKFITLLL